jgi:hypothetical protein
VDEIVLKNGVVFVSRGIQGEKKTKSNQSGCFDLLIEIFTIGGKSRI